MFCPKCGAENSVEQHYCRTCGLKLDAIANEVEGQFPSKELGELARRRILFEKFGMITLSIAGLIGAMLLIAAATYYKLMLVGPEALFGTAIIALIVFVLLTVFLFAYPKLFMQFDRDNKQTPSKRPGEISTPTQKLIEDRPFEPIGSVTEHSTDLLTPRIPSKKQRD